MSLQARLNDFKERFTRGDVPFDVSQEKLESFAEARDRANQELIDSGIMEQVLGEGDQAPTFALPDTEGTIVDSDRLLQEGPLVVNFYRGVWWPYCNIELEALQEHYSTFRRENAELMAISPQSIKFSRRIAREKNLSFPVLSDEGNEVAGQFGLVFELPEYLRSKYKELGADLERFNGEDSWTLPMPARYLIGSDRTIHWADVNPDYMQRPEPRETLEALRDLPPKG